MVIMCGIEYPTNDHHDFIGTLAILVKLQISFSHICPSISSMTSIISSFNSGIVISWLTQTGYGSLRMHCYFKNNMQMVCNPTSDDLYLHVSIQVEVGLIVKDNFTNKIRVCSLVFQHLVDIVAVRRCARSSSFCSLIQLNFIKDVHEDFYLKFSANCLSKWPVTTNGGKVA